MDLREIETRLEQLQERPTYRTGEFVFDLGQERCQEVVQSRPGCGTYKLADGRWVSWYELESPLRQTTRRVVRHSLEAARDRLRARELAHHARWQRAIAAAAAMGLAGLAAGLYLIG